MGEATPVVSAYQQDHEHTKHVFTVGFVKLQRGGVITRHDMQQYKRIYQEIEAQSRRSAITLPAFRRYLGLTCPSLVYDLDMPTNTTMYRQIARGTQEHFSFEEFLTFVCPRATRREISLAMTMVGEKQDKPHLQVAAEVVREIIEIFKFWDSSGDGELQFDEIRQQLLLMMPLMQVEEMMVDCRRFDDDKSGGLRWVSHGRGTPPLIRCTRIAPSCLPVKFPGVPVLVDERLPGPGPRRLAGHRGAHAAGQGSGACSQHVHRESLQRAAPLLQDVGSRGSGDDVLRSGQVPE